MASSYVKWFIRLSSILVLLLLAIQFELFGTGPRGPQGVHAIRPLDVDARPFHQQVPDEENVVAQNTSLWYTPHELDFGEVGVDILSARHVVTLTNVGATIIDFSGGTAPAPFSCSHDCAGSLNPGESCHYFYRFRPTEAGPFSATSGPSSDAGPLVITLHGTGVGPDFTYSPRSIDFGQVLNGTTTDPRTVTIKNIGLATLDFTGGDASAPFSATNTCAPILEPGQTCEYMYRFSPTSDGIFTAITGPVSNDGKQMEVQLTGRGFSGDLPANSFVVSPLELDFGPVGLGQTSAPQVVTIASQSTGLSNIAGGDVDAPFSVNSNCTGDVPAGDSCSYMFQFSPNNTGVFSETSNSTSSLGPFMILLHGTGEGAKKSVSPLSLDFGPVRLNTASPPQRVIIQNTSATALTNFTGGGVSPPFSVTQNCAGDVPPGGSCSYTFRFSPTATGIFSETSSTSSNAGPFTIQMSGGMAPPLLEARFTSTMIEQDGTSTLELAITNPNPNLALTNVSVSNDLPAGLLVASASSASSSDECGTPSFSPESGETSLSFTEGTIEGGETCLVQVDLTAPASGTYVNTTNAVRASNPAGTGNAATATLIVSHERYLPKVHK